MPRTVIDRWNVAHHMLYGGAVRHSMREVVFNMPDTDFSAIERRVAQHLDSQAMFGNLYMQQPNVERTEAIMPSPKELMLDLPYVKYYLEHIPALWEFLKGDMSSEHLWIVQWLDHAFRDSLKLKEVCERFNIAYHARGIPKSLANELSRVIAAKVSPSAWAQSWPEELELQRVFIDSLKFVHSATPNTHSKEDITASLNYWVTNFTQLNALEAPFRSRVQGLVARGKMNKTIAVSSLVRQVEEDIAREIEANRIRRENEERYATRMRAKGAVRREERWHLEPSKRFSTAMMEPYQHKGLTFKLLVHRHEFTHAGAMLHNCLAGYYDNVTQGRCVVAVIHQHKALVGAVAFRADLSGIAMTEGRDRTTLHTDIIRFTREYMTHLKHLQDNEEAVTIAPKTEVVYHFNPLAPRYTDNPVDRRVVIEARQYCIVQWQRNRQENNLPRLTTQEVHNRMLELGDDHFLAEYQAHMRREDQRRAQEQQGVYARAEKALRREDRVAPGMAFPAIITNEAVDLPPLEPPQLALAASWTGVPARELPTQPVRQHTADMSLWAGLGTFLFGRTNEP